ncbi:Polar amino acid transport system ATP-binding protein OS=Castellaniella defragrans OX=75697 GN=HNR28_000824 PE=3 SV=1 [Castellaniella defragrans]
MDDSIIRFDEVTKRYGDLVVLDAINLEVKAGDRVSLIGPSGSGKTTILRILMTLEGVNDGRVWVTGEPLWHMKAGSALVPADEHHLRKMRSRIGMVFQHFNLFPNMTACENISNPQQIVLKMDKKEADSNALRLLEKVGLADKARHYPVMLSGGQKQRVAIARALAMKPEIMLFDEITSALDPEMVEEVLQVLRDISRETRMTMLMVTHQMSFAHEFSDQILFLDKGKIVEQGTPERIFRHPEEERTKSFLSKIMAAGQDLG